MKERAVLILALVIFAITVPASAQRKTVIRVGEKSKKIFTNPGESATNATAQNVKPAETTQDTPPQEKKSNRVIKVGQSAKPQRDLNRLWLDVQGRADGKDAVFYIKGSAYSYIQGERPQKLFDIEGYNIRRLIETPERDGYFVATREIVYYKDPQTGEILDRWQNPFTNQTNEVFHILNDPVNFRYRLKDGKYISVSVDGKREFGEQKQPDEWNDYYVWHADVFPFYKLPEMDKNYTAGELFDFYVPTNEIYKKDAPKVMISWSRMSPWLPWMKMDGREGAMVFHARSVRMESWLFLPDKLKNTIRERHPLYMTAPSTVDPNEANDTSWTVYYDEMRKRGNK